MATAYEATEVLPIKLPEGVTPSMIRAAVVAYFEHDHEYDGAEKIVVDILAAALKAKK